MCCYNKERLLQTGADLDKNLLGWSSDRELLRSVFELIWHYEDNLEALTRKVVTSANNDKDVIDSSGDALRIQNSESAYKCEQLSSSSYAKNNDIALSAAEFVWKYENSVTQEHTKNSATKFMIFRGVKKLYGIVVWLRFNTKVGSYFLPRLRLVVMRNYCSSRIFQKTMTQLERG